MSIQINARHPQLTVTGFVGTAYQAQWTDNPSVTNAWSNLALGVLSNPPPTIADLTSLSARHRYYRAVWTPSTNLVWISPGTFTMGSPASEALRGSDETQHLVTISRGFWMGKYPVTQGDYSSVVGKNPSTFQPPTSTMNLNRPVENVSWTDVSNYCSIRTQNELAAGLIPAKHEYRLPTEAEWEYARRAGTTTPFYLGSGLLSGQANFNGQQEYDATAGDIFNANGFLSNMTSPVGTYEPNGWGGYDMIGNVWEWCGDWYGAYPVGPVIDPRGPATGSVRVARGGGWRSYGWECRAAKRISGDPSSANSIVGFRVVLAEAQ